MRKGSRVGAAEGGNDLPSCSRTVGPQSSVETYLRTWNKKRWLGLTWKPTWSSCTTHKTEDGPKVRQDVASDPGQRHAVHVSLLGAPNHGYHRKRPEDVGHLRNDFLR